MYRTIIAAIDFSKDSDRALAAAIRLAKQDAARIVVVHALEDPIPSLASYAVRVPDDHLETLRSAARQWVEDAAARIADEGVEVEWVLGGGPAALSIVEQAEKYDADLIVMGTRGRTGLEHVLLGSVAERTVRLAPCSVLTVKDSSSD